MKTKPHLPLLLLALLAALHFLLLAGSCPPALTSPDAQGYFFPARLLAEEGTTTFRPATPLAYIGMHMLETGPGTFASRYPPGVALTAALPRLLFGAKASLLLTPFLASLTLLFLFLLCRPRVGPWPALLAAALFALHPLADRHALNWGAHTHATFFLLAGTWLLASLEYRPSMARAAGAGLLLGLVPAMRFAESAAGLGAAAFLLLLAGRGREYRRLLLPALLGALPPLALLMSYNLHHFGSPLATGYALTGEQQLGSGFHWEFLAAKWAPYLTALMGSGMGLLLAPGLLGLAGMWARRESRAPALLLTGIIVPITAVYTAYYWGAGEGGGPGGGGEGLRFLLPTLPFYLLPAFWFLRRLPAGRGGAAGLAVVVLLQGAVWARGAALEVRRAAHRMAAPARVCAWLEEHCPPGSILIADRRLADTVQYRSGWTVLDGGLLAGRRGEGGPAGRPGPAGTAGPGMEPPGARPFGPPGSGPPDARGAGRRASGRASPRQEGKARSLRERYDLEDRRERGRRMADDLYALAGSTRPVYWLGRERQVRRFEEHLLPCDRFRRVHTFRIDPPRPARRRRGPGTAARTVALEVFELDLGS